VRKKEVGRGLGERERSNVVKQMTKAQALLNKHHLGFLWYGKVIKYADKTYKAVYKDEPPLPGFGEALAAYSRDADKVYLFSNDVRAPDIVHELGHRYWHKFLSSTDKHNFENWFGRIQAPSAYGATKATEEFPELFSSYVMGRWNTNPYLSALNKEQRQRFINFLGRKERLESMRSLSFAKELAEAVEAPPIPEQVSFLDTLDENVTTALYTGFFTEETMESAFISILMESGYTPGYENEFEVFEAIEEYIEEELELLELKDSTKATIKKHGGSFLKSVGRQIAKDASGPLSKRVTQIKTKSKAGKMLKHAAAGAIKQIGRDPSKAKEVLKRGAKRAGRKLVKSAVKRGMKMVFGKWLKTEHEMIEAAYMPPFIESVDSGSDLLVEGAYSVFQAQMAQALGLNIRKSDMSVLVNSFIDAYSKLASDELFGGLEPNVDITKTKRVKEEGEEEVYPFGSAGPHGAPEFIPWTATVQIPTELTFYHAFNAGIPQVVEGMASKIRSLTGSNDEVMSMRQNLARIIMKDPGIFRKLLTAEMEEWAKSVRYKGQWDEELNEFVLEEASEDLEFSEKPSWNVSIKAVKIRPRMKLVSAGGRKGSDIYVEASTVWNVKMDNAEFKLDTSNYY